MKRRGLFGLLASAPLAAAVPSLAKTEGIVGVSHPHGETYWSARDKAIRSQSGVKVRVWFDADRQVWRHYEHRLASDWHCDTRRTSSNPKPPENWTHGLSYDASAREWRNC
jgi:hypothetical protein